jgi:hypothetical protein
MSYSSEPLLDTLGMAVIEDRGQEKFADLPPRPPFSPGIAGDDPYARRLRRLATRPGSAARAASIRPTTSRTCSPRRAARAPSS